MTNKTLRAMKSNEHRPRDVPSDEHFTDDDDDENEESASEAEPPMGLKSNDQTNPKKINEQRQFTSNDDNQFFSPIHIRLFHNNNNKEKNHLANSSFLDGPIDAKKKKKQN